MYNYYFDFSNPDNCNNNYDNFDNYNNHNHLINYLIIHT